MTSINLALAFIAGLLTTLSPCVLPVLPFVTASSLDKSRAGPVALCAGLLATFVGVSLLVSSSGYPLGFEPSLVKKIAGILLAASGLLFLSPGLADRLTTGFTRFTGKAGSALTGSYSGPLLTELVRGLLLGVVWTPCSGPSLGAALSFAAQSGTIGRAAGVLSVFGGGAVLPLMLFAYGTRGAVARFRQSAVAIWYAKKGFGLLMMLFGLAIGVGWDHRLESQLTQALPDFWIAFVTKY